MARTKPSMEKVWADTGTKLEPADVKKDLGHVVEIPDYRIANWLENRRDQFLAHLNDWGIPEYDSASIYPIKGWTRSTVDGEIYVSKVVSNQGNEPSISPAEWDSLSQYLSSSLLQVISGGVVGNIVTVAASGQVQDSGTSLQDVLTSLTPQGNWDASTNTPTLPGAATTGDFWIVSVAGATDLGGITTWEVNDWAVKTATGWAKVDNTTSLTTDELAAIQAADSPSASNPFSTDSVSKVEAIGSACSDETSDLLVGAGKVKFRVPFAMTLTGVRASVNTAPTGANLIVDINEEGVSILSTKLSIDAGTKSSEASGTPAVISDSALADDAEISVDVDQIGSTIAGAGLKIWLIGVRA